MALTHLQRAICQLIARHRISTGESYVAGGAALNEILSGLRFSRDVDLFHDTDSALDATWRADRQLLEQSGFAVQAIRERPAFVEAEVSQAGESVVLQWVRDSAYRFFPLVEHPVFGLALHPFDLATNKVLALVGRLEVRDWIDVMHCSARLQPLGYLMWAACGKDPGFSPTSILEHAGRSSHYSTAEVASLAFDGPPPDAGLLSRQWRALLAEAGEIVRALPSSQSGKCVLGSDGDLFTGLGTELTTAIERSGLRFHAGSIRGALPRIAGT